MAGVSVRVRIMVRDGVRISNRVRGRVKLLNYSLITVLPTATSAHPLFIHGRPQVICGPADWRMGILRTKRADLVRKIPTKATMCEATI